MTPGRVVEAFDIIEHGGLRLRHRAVDFQGGYVVALDKAMLEKAPRYAQDAEPSFDRSYGREVYGYYGMNYPF